MDSVIKNLNKNNKKNFELQEELNVNAYVYPEPSMFDSKISIVIKNLPPNNVFTLHSSTKDKNTYFECLAVYCSNSAGEINLKEHRCLDGFYTGIEPMGLLWAMKPHSGSKKRLMKEDVTTPLVIEVNIYEGAIISTENFHSSQQKHSLTHFSITRLLMAPGVKRLEVNEEGLLGALFLPSGEGPFPGIISMFGGMPGTLEYKPALLASRGYAALALPYSGLEGLTKDLYTMHMEYFEKAVSFLRSRPYVCTSRGIGIIGLCKGGQLALAMADLLEGINCVIAINCSIFSHFCNHYCKGQVWKSAAENEGVNEAFLTKTDQGSYITRNAFSLLSMHDPEFESKLFHFHKRPSVSYMYIAGLEDENVPSEHFCNVAEKLLKSVNHPNYVVLRYPGAGHLLEAPYFPLCFEGYFDSIKSVMCYGGKPLQHCRAQEDSWKQQLEFLRLNLVEKRNANL